MGVLDVDRGLVAGRGSVLIGEVGATPPTLAQLRAYAADYTALPTGHAPIGTTDPEDLPEWDSDGGDTEMLHTWEFPNAREVTTDPRTDYFTVKPLQFDNDTMKLWEGGGDATETEIFWAPGIPVPTTASATVVMIDTSGNIVGYHVPKVSIRKESGIELDREDWAKLPMRFTELTHVGAKGPHAWIGANFGVPATSPTP